VSLKIVCFGPAISPHFQKFCDRLIRCGAVVFTFDEGTRRLVPYENPVSANGEASQTPALLVWWKRLAVFFLRPILEWLNLIREIQSLRREILRVQADIVQVHWLWRWSFIAVFLKRPVVLTAWGSDIEFPEHTNWLERRKMRYALRRAQAVTAPSAYIEELLVRSGVPRDRLRRIVFPGIEVGQFADSSHLIPDLELAPESVLILSPRALDPFYRIHVIVEAFGLIRREIPNAILLLLDYNRDPPGYLAHLRNQIEGLGLTRDVVIFENMALPYPHMPEIYKRSFLAISIPEGDGVPGSYLEAMAAGCPIVSVDLKTYDGILDHETTGLRVVVNPESIAGACLRLWRNPDLRERIISNARIRVEQVGNAEAQMEKFLTLYKELA